MFTAESQKVRTILKRRRRQAAKVKKTVENLRMQMISVYGTYNV